MISYDHICGLQEILITLNIIYIMFYFVHVQSVADPAYFVSLGTINRQILYFQIFKYNRFNFLIKPTHSYNFYLYFLISKENFIILHLMPYWFNTLIFIRYLYD
jgi:hypothetical protein